MKLYDFLFGEKEISMFQEAKFRRITLALSLLIGLSIPIDMYYPIPDQLYDLLVLLTFGFAALWTRDKFILIGFILIGLKFNTGLLYSQSYLNNDLITFKNILKWIRLVFSASGTMLFIYGCWRYYKIKEELKITKNAIISTFINVVVITIALQMVVYVVF